jgi:hypothetical protein
VPVGATITDTQLAVNAAELAGGSGAKVRVMASDGMNNSADESDAPFTVERKEPQVHILWPEGDGTIPPGTPLFLEGYAYDLEDGVLGEASLHWSSSEDGDLGMGSQALVTLSPGQHVITFTATDSDGNTATATINVLVSYETNETYLPIILKNYAPPVPPTGPDLVVTGITTDPASPSVGEEATIHVTVKNQGNQAANSWFFIDLYVDPASPPDDRADLGTYYGYGPTSGLVPGQTHQVSFSHTFGSGGDHTLYAQVDTYDGLNGSPDYGMIQESIEGNNIYGPVSVSVSGTSVGGEEAPLPETGPRPTPAAGP